MFVNALTLPLNYFLELGLFFVVAVMQWRRMRNSQSFFRHKDLCGLVMAATSVVICSFLRSSVIAKNDLGWRGFLVAQFVLLIWAAEFWDEGVLVSKQSAVRVRPRFISPDDRRRLMALLLVLGVTGSLYEVFMTRFYFVTLDKHQKTRNALLAGERLGERTYELRQVYQSLDKILPESAVVQHNPNAEPGDAFYGLYADRQAAAETSACGVVFGGDPALCSAIIGPIYDLFEMRGAVDAGRVDEICRDLSIDALVVKDTDKVWADKNSWVWKKQPDLANDSARVFLCGKSKTGRL